MRVKCYNVLYDSQGCNVGFIGAGISYMDVQSPADLILPLVEGGLEKYLTQVDARKLPAINFLF